MAPDTQTVAQASVAGATFQALSWYRGHWPSGGCTAREGDSDGHCGGRV